MKLDRFRGALVVMGIAALAVGGASAVAAQTPLAAATKLASTVSVSRAASEPTSPDTDNVQSGDQIGTDAAGAEDAGGPDTDNIQEGDQTTPDGAAASPSSRRAPRRSTRPRIMAMHGRQPRPQPPRRPGGPRVRLRARPRLRPMAPVATRIPRVRTWITSSKARSSRLGLLSHRRRWDSLPAALQFPGGFTPRRRQPKRCRACGADARFAVSSGQVHSSRRRWKV